MVKVEFLPSTFNFFGLTKFICFKFLRWFSKLVMSFEFSQVLKLYQLTLINSFKCLMYHCIDDVSYVAVGRF